MSEWILCKDRLPDKKGYYLISEAWGEVDICKYDLGNRQWFDLEDVPMPQSATIAWMPLPKPYNEE